MSFNIYIKKLQKVRIATIDSTKLQIVASI